jgi:hypothetical protein
MRLRLQRNYLMLVYFITGVWVTKIYIHPESVRSVGEFYSRMGVGGLFPSWFVALTAAVFVLSATLFAVVTPREESLESWTYAKHFERLTPGTSLPKASEGPPRKGGEARAVPAGEGGDRTPMG